MNINKIFSNGTDCEVEDVMTDSRLVMPNSIFFCLVGMKFDGHDYIEQAVENGAVCIVHSKKIEKHIPNIVYIQVEDSMKTLNDFLRIFYGNPTKNMEIFGVTGTNGKTTIAWTIRYIVSHFKKCGLIGTIEISWPGVKDINPGAGVPTTPESAYLNKTLYRMHKDGCEACAMECSSNGIECHRIDAVDFDYVIYTNLTHDHLDVHGNFENYYKAKARLFTMVGPQKTAIINIDDEYGVRLMKETTARAVSYAVDREADYRAINITSNNEFTEFDVIHQGKSTHIKMNLFAMFNVYNILAVIATLHEAGYAFEDFVPLLQTVPQVCGRVERVNAGQKFNVIVDYAHTPDGYEKIFQYARKITPGAARIIAVVGCSGNRDHSKRALLGEMCDKYANVIIVTMENPRSEDPDELAHSLQEGIKKHKSIYVRYRDMAIAQAIEIANPKDTILILGKGDEAYLEQATHKEAYDGDQKVAYRLLTEYLERNKEDEVE